MIKAEPQWIALEMQTAEVIVDIVPCCWSGSHAELFYTKCILGDMQPSDL